ncbi:aspartate carbamoyltransferase [Methylomonas sp. BW4-1]|uniref:aspartate carbamoyltransferase n=1 Tax=Methylomonas sp. BW4-1 TaxID=3376685 RepID=UPI0040425255
MKKLLLIAALVLTVSTVQAIPPFDPSRLDEVQERGSHVMPFALEKTLHIFNKTDTGGIQQVIAKDAADSQQIGLVRSHLSQLATHFAAGDFSGPQRIHGDDMPGLNALASAAGKVSFAYRELPNGAEIEYRSEDKQLIGAVHSYFDAQLSDHARHAVPGGQQMHHGKHHP